MIEMKGIGVVMTKKDNIRNKKTEAIKNRIFANNARSIRRIYYKCCIMSGTLPKYSSFCAVTNFNGIKDEKLGIIRADSPDLDKDSIQKDLMDDFVKWRSNCFVFTDHETSIIYKNDLAGGIRCFLRR